MKTTWGLTRVALVTSISILVLIFGTPLALELVRRIYQFDWAKLSDVGQSYTGAATVLSVLAFAGVVYSIVLQSRQTIGQQQQASRELQFQLMTMALENSALGEIWSESESMSPERYAKFRAEAYIVCVFRYLQYSYVVGVFSERTLRETLREEYFPNPKFRRQWLEVEELWRQVYAGLELEFCEIASDECQRIENSI